MNKRIAVPLLLLVSLLAACKPQPGISGRITDANGHALEGISVLLEDSGNFRESTQTDASGHYSFADPASKHYALTIKWEADPTCPSYNSGYSAVQSIQGFLTGYADNGYSHSFLAVQDFDYEQGKGMRFDLKIPCTATATSVPPTYDTTLLDTSTPFATSALQPTNAGGTTSLSTPIPVACPTRVAETATAFAAWGFGNILTLDLTNTTWEATASTGETYTLTFLPGSSLDISEKAPNPGPLPCSYWRQTGDGVIIAANYGMSQWVGSFTGTDPGSELSGTAFNSYGLAWAWTAKKH